MGSISTGSQFLNEVLKCKTSIQRTISKSDVKNRVRSRQLARLAQRQVDDIALIYRGKHPLFLPTDYDKDGRVKDCMSIVERMDPDVHFSAFEKRAGYLSQLEILDHCRLSNEDDDFLCGRDLPAESYTQALRTGKVRVASADDILIPKGSLPFLSTMAESGYAMTSRICSPVRAVSNIYLAPAVKNKKGEWERKLPKEHIECDEPLDLSASLDSNIDKRGRLTLLDIILC